MTARYARIALVVLFISLYAYVIYQHTIIHEMRQYIEKGCQGRYQGAGS